MHHSASVQIPPLGAEAAGDAAAAEQDHNEGEHHDADDDADKLADAANQRNLTFKTTSSSKKIERG